MSQMTFSDYEYSLRKRKTKREEFLDIMNEIIPWEEWVEFVCPYYPNGKRGRPTKGIEKMLRAYYARRYNRRCNNYFCTELNQKCGKETGSGNALGQKRE